MSLNNLSFSLSLSLSLPLSLFSLLTLSFLSLVSLSLFSLRFLFLLSQTCGGDRDNVNTMHTQTSLCLCVDLIFTAGRNKKTLERRSTAEEENYDPRTQRSDVCIAATRPTPYQVSGSAAGSAPRQAEKKRHDRPHIRQVPGRRLENRREMGKKRLSKTTRQLPKTRGTQAENTETWRE